MRIDNTDFFVHDKYFNYGANEKGEIRNIFTNGIPKQSPQIYNGEWEMIVHIWKDGCRHRLLKKNFIYECIKGVELEPNDLILPINSNSADLQIVNLVRFH